MSLQKTLIKTYFGSVSTMAPQFAARNAFKLFQKVRKKNIREREEKFFQDARKFNVEAELDHGKTEHINCYELGEAGKPLVILVHGWDSNAGSMSKIAYQLVAEGRRVVLFNLPGHAFYKRSFTNLLECREAFSAVLKVINPEPGFSVVSHSFGSAVTAYALSKNDYQLDKLVFLTNPNKVERIFEDFRNFIGLGDRAYNKLLEMAQQKLGEPIQKVNVVDNLSKIDFEKILLIHDKNDKVLDYYNSLEVKEAISKAELLTYENIGHYKMLWNDMVITDCTRFLSGTSSHFIKEEVANP